MAVDNHPFVSESEAEKLAVEHIEKYMNACNCKSVADAKFAIQKMAAVELDCMDKIHNGRPQKLSTH